MASVEEYATWRGVSPQRVRELLRSGELPGHRVGGYQWVVDDAAYGLRPARTSPLSPPMAWALIALLSGDEPTDHLSAVQRSRLRAYRNKLVHAPDAPALLTSWLRHRGERLVFRGHGTDLLEFSEDRRVMKSGISDPRSGLSAGETVEVWLRSFMGLQALIEEYLLVPDPTGQFVVHRGREHPEREAQIGLVIADLAEWNQPRQDGRVFEMLARVA